jgi:hypothetical protein
MVEANSHLNLLPTSLFDIYKVFDLIDMLSIGIWLQPYTVNSLSAKSVLAGEKLVATYSIST